MLFPGLDHEVEENKLSQIELGEQQMVSEQGRQWIHEGIQRMYGIYPVWPVGWSWHWLVEDKDAPFKGTLPKRVASFLYQEYRLKTNGEWLSRMGTDISNALIKSTSLMVDFTRKINWNSHAFGQVHGSCFWGGHRNSKNLIESYGGAFRFWRDAPEYLAKSRRRDIKRWKGKAYQGWARGWVVAKPELGVSFLFNVYGLDGRNHEMANALAKWLGLEWEHIGLTASRIYINHYNHNGNNGKSLTGSGSPGFMIGQPETLKRLTAKCYDLDLRY